MLLGHAASRGPGRGPDRRRPRHVVRRPDGARSRARRGDRRPQQHRQGPLRLLGHRGHHVGDPAGSRLHRPGPGVKFAGCYHGHVDCLLASAGSGLATLAVPGTPGVPAGAAAATIVLPYNDREAVARAFAEHGEESPASSPRRSRGNMGLVPPSDGFNQFLPRPARVPEPCSSVTR